MPAQGKFRTTKFDPIKIVVQILLLQCLLYFTAALILYIVDITTGESFVLDQIFNYKEIHVANSGIIFAFVANALVGAILLWCIVKRTKLCLDFSCTFHLIHLLVCWWYYQFPSTFSWWLLNIACATLMCIIGEFLCLKTELQEIPVGYLKLAEV